MFTVQRQPQMAVHHHAELAGGILYRNQPSLSPRLVHAPRQIPNTGTEHFYELRDFNPAFCEHGVPDRWPFRLP